MKRLLAALAATCLFATAATARTLVILPPSQCYAGNANFENGAKTQEQLFLSALYTTNAQFDVVRGEQLTNGTATASPPLLVNQYLRAGMYWPLGMGVGTPSTYGLVIHLGVSASAGGVYGNYRPDSLTLIGNATNGSYWPTVPQLFIGNTLATVNALVTSGACSTGVAAHIAYSVHQDSTYNLYDLSNTSRTWKSYVGNVVKSPRIVRGWRPLVGGISTRPTDGPADGLYDYPAWNNGVYPTDPDTVAAWIVYNYASGTATPIAGTVLGSAATAAPCIFTSICRQTVSENEVGLLLGALQTADSLSGGALYGVDVKAIEVAAHIDDGWKRGQSNVGNSGGSGIAWTDTLALNTAIAGMNVLPGFKYALGFEADSMYAYQNYDERWWAAATNARLTPHIHGGQANDAPAPPQNVLAHDFMVPFNIWGINPTWTRYAFGSAENIDSLRVYGLPDYVQAVTDTMVTYWHSKRAFSLCDSMSRVMWGRTATDHLVMPPADDWTNRRATHKADSAFAVNTVDSILAAASLSGATGVRSNQMSASSATIHNAAAANYGYYQNQQTWVIGSSAVPASFPTRVYGTPCFVIGVEGYPNTTYSAPNSVGSRRSWTSQVRGKPGFFQDLLHGAIGYPPGVVTYSAVNGWASTTVKGIPTYGQNLCSNMVAIHVADLGSNGVENTMPGYYNFKYLANTMAYANARGRQPIIRFVWPEDIRP